MVVRPLDARLGKVPSISAAALMDDGSPVLIVDVEDLARSVETLLHGGRLRGLGRRRDGAGELASESWWWTTRHGARSAAVASAESRIRRGGCRRRNGRLERPSRRSYNLTITDVDMPRMTGIELVSKIKADPKLNALPVIIVSYKDREEDRMRGLDAGADRYLTKSSFHDQTLLSAVEELIGLPE
jgi:two-component system sensor histidine kinase and response regulator WspE